MNPTGTLLPEPVAVMAGAQPGELHGAYREATIAGHTARFVDLATVADSCGVARAGHFRDYHARCLALWSGEDLPTIDVCTSLVDASQVARGDRRKDLSVEADALMALPGFGTFLDAATAASPDPTAIASARIGLAITTTHGQLPPTGPRGQAAVRWRTSAQVPWPACLGGSYRPSEVEREFEVELRWAPWRDRRARRVTRVLVRSLQRWPAL